MITESDIKTVEAIKQFLRKSAEKPDETMDWEIIMQIECLDRMVHGLKIAPLSFKHVEKDSKFFTAECANCGWWGSSELLEGGGQIADTGDYSDPICPACYSDEIDDKEEEE